MTWTKEERGRQQLLPSHHDVATGFAPYAAAQLSNGCATVAADHEEGGSTHQREPKWGKVDGLLSGAFPSPLLQLCIRLTSPAQLSIPRSCSKAGVKLLSLTPFTTFLSHVVYSLPLSSSFAPVSPDALRSARVLGIPVGGELEGGTIGRSKASLVSRVVHPRTLKVVEQDLDLLLVDGDDPPGEGFEAKDDEKLDWIVVLEFVTTFGGLQGPDFANTVRETTEVIDECALTIVATQVFIPLPLCLRNSLTLTLPPPPSPDLSLSTSQRQAWDLAVRPTLRPSSSDDSDPNAITGVFTSTPVLAIRWAPSSFTNHDILIPRSTLKVLWNIGELGWSEAAVRGHFPITYAGLKEKGFIDLNVAHTGGGMGVFEVMACEGEGVIAWEVLRDGPARKRVRSNGGRAPFVPLEEGRKRMLTHESEDSEGMGSPGGLGALEWRRPTLLSQAVGLRTPSFTSLFDTLPPVAPEIDTAVLRRMNEPSLLRTEAPFGGSQEDVSFDGLDREREASHGSSSDAGEDPSVVKINTLRIHLNLFDILRPDNCIVSLSVTASFPSITLRSLSTAFNPLEGQLCIALPIFSIPSATREDTVVTVDAGPESLVNLLQPDRDVSISDLSTSPLPAVDGKARWTTKRTREDRESSSEIVHCEVMLPSSRPTTLLIVEEDVEATYTPSTPVEVEDESCIVEQDATHSPSTPIDQAASLPPRLDSPPPPIFLPTIIPPLRLRITPVPPSSLHASWRLFTQVTFSYPFEGSFSLRGKDGQKVSVMGVWNGKGEAGDLALLVRIRDRGVVSVACQDVGVCEVMYCVEEEAEKGGVPIGDVLPVFSLPVAAMEVEVLAINGESHLLSYDTKLTTVRLGWELSMKNHTFDAVTQQTFSRFDLPPSCTPRLSVHLIPSPVPLPIAAIAESKEPGTIAPPPPSFGTSLEWLALLGPFFLVSLAFLLIQLDTTELLDHGRLRFLNDVPSVVLSHFGFPESPPSSTPLVQHSTYVVPTVVWQAAPTPEVTRALSNIGSTYEQLMYWPSTLKLTVLSWLFKFFRIQ
jgi:hypothetical protein